MSLFKKVTNISLQPAEEGWGIIFMGGWLSTPILMSAGEINLKQLLKQPKLQKYLKSECARVYNEEKKKDKSVTYKMKNSVSDIFRQVWHSTDNVGIWAKVAHFHEMGFKSEKTNIGEYSITYFFDTDHIQAITLLLYSANRDEYICRLLTPPTKAELGFRHE